MTLTYRELLPSEFASIPPEATAGLAIPEHCVVVGALEGDRVVAICGILPVLHLEPLWLAEDHRKSPSLLRRLWATTRQVLVDKGIGRVLLISVPDTERIAAWCGATELVGSKPYIIDISRSKE